MTITENIQQINRLIHQTELACHRPLNAVQLLSVSKHQTTAKIEEAFAAGLRDFGESYLQEAQVKILQLASLPICWHFIGPIQSNKTAGIAAHFSWVHSLSRKKIAQQLNDQRPLSLPPLNICLQINMDQESSKAGVPPSEAEELASFVLQLPRLKLRGLMVIPKPEVDEQCQYESFLRLTQLMQTLNQQLHITMDTLSMGMSHDVQAAIRAGSTIVRIGTAIFGARENSK